jgi:hypothetical protein
LISSLESKVLEFFDSLDEPNRRELLLLLADDRSSNWCIAERFEVSTVMAGVLRKNVNLLVREYLLRQQPLRIKVRMEPTTPEAAPIAV